MFDYPSIIGYYIKNDNEEYNLINDFNKPIKATNESQGHGKPIERGIQTKIFKMDNEMINTYKNNDIHDIRSEHNNHIKCKGKNISIKTTGSNTVCCSKVTRFLKLDNTIMIIAQWEQNENQKKIIKTYSFDINCLIQELKQIIKPMLFEDYLNKIEEYEDYVNWDNIPKDSENKDYLEKKKELDNKYITVNPKVNRSQRRVQCSINMNVINTLPSFKSWGGSKFYNYTYDNIIESSPRKRNSITIDKLKKYAKGNNIKGPGKRGGWPNMTKKDIISYLEGRGLCITDIK